MRDSRYFNLNNEFLAEPWWRFNRVKSLKNVGLFTFGGKINSLK